MMTEATTKPRTLEEIREWLGEQACRCLEQDEPWFRSDCDVCVLVALREAADAAWEAGLKLGTTLQAEAIEQARCEEREALRAERRTLALITVVRDCRLYERSEARLADILPAGSYVHLELCSSRWDLSHARSEAERITARPLVLVGARTCTAFRVPYRPFKADGGILVLPHPSGRCREWNKPNAVRRARAAVQALRRD